MSASLVGVGVGPGDPELLTLRALRTLRGADRIFAPTVAFDATGRAEVIVRGADPALRVERLVFAMASDPASRVAAQETAAARVVTALDDGENVAFVTLGDPNVYSTFHHLVASVRRIRPDVPISTVPGIMAFQELAARAGAPLLDGSQPLALVIAVDGLDDLDRALHDPHTAIVVYKGGGRLPEITQRLAVAGRLDAALLGELLGLPGERVVALRDHDGLPATYLASVIVPPAVAS